MARSGTVNIDLYNHGVSSVYELSVYDHVTDEDVRDLIQGSVTTSCLLDPVPTWLLKGCGMGPWHVLVSPCFRENVVATCKIGSFLCSLDNLLQKNVIVFCFGNKMSKWRSFAKRAIFDLLFTFFSQQGKVTKNSFSTYLTRIHTRILLTLLTFFALPILKKIRIYQVRFLFGMSPGVDSSSRHFGTINK